MSRLELFASHVRVVIESRLASATAALQAIWAAASSPYVPTRQVERFSVEPDADGWSVLHGDRTVHTGLADDDVAPAAEGAIYRGLLDWHSQHTVFHAACVVHGRTPALFVGDSGSGKSSLALCAVRAGFDYFGDEHVITDGNLVWGLPRAIQFDVIGSDEQLPDWLEGADTSSYRLRDRDGRRKVLPFFSVGERAARRALPAAEARVFFLHTARSTSLRPRSPLEALQGLHEAALGTPHAALGTLVGPSRAFELEWSDPHAAIEQVVFICSAAR
jgi:hypothetical protein